MIGWLSGKLLDSSENPILLEINGVGYEVELPISYYENLNSFILKSGSGDNLSLYIHSHYREDAQLLFGFFEASQKKLFRELIRVSGVGAKSALMILSTFDVPEFVNIIHRNDSQILTQVPGIGKKSAERLLIECQDRILKMDFSNILHNQNNKLSDNIAISGTMENNIAEVIDKQIKNNDKFNVISDATEALLALGYKPHDARVYAKKCYQDNMSTQQLIKSVLQVLKQQQGVLK